jgi:hypothetical protein
MNIITKKFMEFLIKNRGPEMDFLESNEFSVLECAKILNKKYKIGLINSYIVVNSIKAG